MNLIPLYTLEYDEDDANWIEKPIFIPANFSYEAESNESFFIYKSEYFSLFASTGFYYRHVDLKKIEIKDMRFYREFLSCIFNNEEEVRKIL